MMIISESLAREFFGEENAAGRRLAVDLGEPIVHEVIGVAADARLSTLQDEPYHTMYFAFAQVPLNRMRLAVRTRGDPESLPRPIRNLLRSKDPNIPIAEPATMASIIDDAVDDHRVITASLECFQSSPCCST